MEYKLFQGIPQEEAILQGILHLYENIFQTDSGSLLKEMEKKELLIIVALDQSRVVGYKMGYKHSEVKFYSWLGGVDPEYRNRGIASELMRIQHDVCQQQGYQRIQTKTKNKWRNMLILNLKHGFDIIGTYTDDRGEPKIILEKRLNK